MNKKHYPIEKTEADWLKELGEEKYRVLRQKGTERAHSGDYNLHFKSGKYFCAACNALLFESATKFDSGCGWPSFDQAVEGSIEYLKDTSYGMIRTEILCSQCGSHLGHVFDDGPTETGQRYCVNSLSLKFNKSS
ncbi:peptide-methionine (R)-S-oxide reductase MsrB [uncultured Planktosalinus sp.]|uniref:peptide-methionine (R)-S-oxide reductase MsrB n=1 Tax=uncultured Planktosalinus sp. TaxID=1810935 RepID=UPI0030D87A74